MYVVQAGRLLIVLVLNRLFCMLREDTMNRWCATEVDSEGVMVPVGIFSPFFLLQFLDPVLF